MIRYAAIPAYFGVRVASALVLLKLSAAFLSVRGFADFTQFLAFASLLNMAVLAGAQNGLIRQAAAARDDELDAVHGSGLAILLVAVPVLGIPVCTFSPQISTILTGSPDQWRVVVGLLLLALSAGPGQVFWSLLTGRKCVAQSLGVQAFGMIAGAGAAAWFITRGRVGEGALAFAAGPAIAALASLPMIAGMGLGWRPNGAGLKALLRYSAGIASTLAFSALVLFALRSVYRTHFGPTELGYWLAANRISDLSTQFIGLFMIQAFVPQITASADPVERSRMVIRYGAAGALLTGLALLVFFVAGHALVHLFLSDAYLPAIASIRLYMIGDFARVWVSVAMFTALAAGRPGRYAAIEISTMGLMGILTLILVRTGELLAPQIAYLLAFVLAAIAIWGAAFVQSHRWHPRPSGQRGEHRISLEGSVPPLP